MGSTVVCVDIEANRWTDYPDFPLNCDRSSIAVVTPTVTVEKNGKRYNLFPKNSTNHFFEVSLVFCFSDH